LFNDVRYWLFPRPDKIRFDCTCPDERYPMFHWASTWTIVKRLMI